MMNVGGMRRQQMNGRRGLQSRLMLKQANVRGSGQLKSEYVLLRRVSVGHMADCQGLYVSPCAGRGVVVRSTNQKVTTNPTSST